MPEQQTPKSRYKSRYSPDVYVTTAQYIIELVCEKKAKFDRTELPIKFWNLPAWRTFFIKNLRKVHKLLREFDERAIINALNLKCFGNSYSIFTERFLDLVKQEQGKIDQLVGQPVKQQEINRNTIDSKPRPYKSKPNLLTKLDDI